MVGNNSPMRVHRRAFGFVTHPQDSEHGPADPLRHMRRPGTVQPVHGALDAAQRKKHDEPAKQQENQAPPPQEDPHPACQADRGTRRDLARIPGEVHPVTPFVYMFFFFSLMRSVSITRQISVVLKSWSTKAPSPTWPPRRRYALINAGTCNIAPRRSRSASGTRSIDWKCAGWARTRNGGGAR